MKALKIGGFGPRKSKKGFTLIELLIVMVILAILAGVVVMAVGGVFGTSRETAYNTAKEEIKNAVAQYASDHMGSLPVNASAADIKINGSACTSNNCDVVLMNQLLISAGGILASLPDSCSSSNSVDCTGSYTWAIDTYGNVYSACTGTSCTGVTGVGNGTDGYADGYMDPVYP